MRDRGRSWREIQLGRVLAMVTIETRPMKCRERLGGVLKFYYREAA